MEFASLIYFIWLSIFMASVWLIPSKYLAYILSAFGFAFVSISSPLAAVILLSESILCFTISKTKIFKSWGFAVSLIIIIAITILIFKYLTFAGSIELPLGISYFTFRLIHYIQDNYRKRTREHSFIEFLAYISFFPTFLLGPINRFQEFITNLRRRKWNPETFSNGLERVFYGYAQLIIIGNFLINNLLKSSILGNIQNESTFYSLLLKSVHLWMDLYIRFSAYSSIAIGISLMAGFEIPENFNYPFFATNIREFWQRWHITLTSWCREYIFVPVAAITRKPYLAIGCTMVAIGIWHELSLRYVLWGIYHSIGIIVYEKWSKLKIAQLSEKKKVIYFRKIIGAALTIIFVVLSFPVTSMILMYLTKLFK